MTHYSKRSRADPHSVRLLIGRLISARDVKIAGFSLVRSSMCAIVVPQEVGSKLLVRTRSSSFIRHARQSATLHRTPQNFARPSKVAPHVQVAIGFGFLEKMSGVRTSFCA